MLSKRFYFIRRTRSTSRLFWLYLYYIFYIIARFIAKSNAFCHFYRKIQCVRKRLHIYSMSIFLVNLMLFFILICSDLHVNHWKTWKMRLLARIAPYYRPLVWLFRPIIIVFLRGFLVYFGFFFALLLSTFSIFLTYNQCIF